jgi:transposase
MKTYRPWEPDRTYLLPPSTRDWLPEDHIAAFILDVVDELDLGAIEAPIQEKDPRGEKPYAPQMMVALLLYGYGTGVFSSRKLARATWTDLGARVIAAESHPHFTTINQFRLDHRAALADLFAQILGLCQKAGMVELGHVAIDGTRIQANASKHKAMSYDRMKETEKRLKAEAEELLRKAEEIDRAEDAAFGADSDGRDIPEELRHRQSRIERLRKAKAELEKEAAAARRMELEEQARRASQAAEQTTAPEERGVLERRSAKRTQQAERLGGAGAADIPGAQDGLPFNTVPHERDGKPKPKAQRNFTDPESRIMATNGTYMQAYNAQIAVDEKEQVIVSCLVTNQGPDVQHFRPLLEQAQRNTQAQPRQATADAGYWSDDNAQFCQDVGIDAYISTRRRRHEEGLEGEAVTPPPVGARTPAASAMEAKVTSPEGREVYAKRKWTAEPVFGEIKEARKFRRFSVRGLEKVRAEWALLCATHNLLKLWRNRTKN